MAVLAIYWLSELPVKRLFGWSLLPVLFVISLVVILMWNEPGTSLISFHTPWISLTLNDNGFLLVLRLLLKALISVTFSLFFLMTTKYAHFSAMIYHIFPAPIDQIFLMSYRFIFITMKMVGSMIKAIKSRGGGLIKSISKQSQMFAEVFALVFIRSYDRAERVNKAMESRGYCGKYIAATEIPRMRSIEYIFLLALFLINVYLLLCSPLI